MTSKVKSEPFLTIRSGPRNARSDAASGMRLYRWRGVEYPSVTSIRRMAGLPHGLHQWAVGKVVEHAIGKADDIATRLARANYDTAIVSVIRQELRNASVAERDAAAAIGSAVHDAAATGKRVEDVEARLRPRLAQYLDWLEVSGVEIIATEFQVWNPIVGYAGTGDLLVRLRNGRVVLVDLKTGKGVWSEHALQVIAYAKAEFSGQDDVIDERVTAALQEVSAIAILHLADAGWEYDLLRLDADTWRAFRGLLLFATWMWKHSRPEDVIIAKRTGASTRYCKHGVDTEHESCPRCGSESREEMREASR